jgi:MFS family permease
MLKTKLQGILSQFIVVNSISWFSLTLFTVMDFSGITDFYKILIISGPYFAGLIFSALIGATLLVQKIREKRFLAIWVILGVVSCLLFYFLAPQATLSTLGILSLILGASVGLGIPASLSMFANQVKSEKLGRIAGLLFFIIQIFTALILLSIESVSIENQFLTFAIWRGLGLIGIIILIENIKNDKETKTSLKKILKDRTFFLYFLPWFMFSLVNFIQVPIVEVFMRNITTPPSADIYNNYYSVAGLISSFTAIGAGFLCDFKGRKITGILGFVLLGIGYAFLSLLPDIVGKYPAVYLFTIFDGLAWGLLYVNFIFVVWGDLSQVDNREKYYFLGGLPFLFSGLIQVLVGPFVAGIPIGTSFSLASFFLLIATLPLLYAPESLSDKLMKNRELFNYVHKALQKVQKEKEISPDKNEEKGDDESEAAETPEDIEARKLAEKYY